MEMHRKIKRKGEIKRESHLVEMTSVCKSPQISLTIGHFLEDLSHENVVQYLNEGNNWASHDNDPPFPLIIASN